MAGEGATTQDAPTAVHADLTTLIDRLYNLMLHAYNYPSTSTNSAIKSELIAALQSLISLSKHSEQLQLDVPIDVITYVEHGRNPDIYTREFVEMVQRLNQEWKGRVMAYRMFRDILAEEIKAGLPDLSAGIDQVLSNTGGQGRPTQR